MNEEISHCSLAVYNRKRLQPGRGEGNWAEEFENGIPLQILEFQIVEELRRRVSDRAAQAPDTPGAFLEWFEDLKASGPGQGDRLFPWLATRATLPQMRWFLTQEMAGEAGFDDLVALTQVKLPDRCKLELARNYWDEMGRGHQEGMHGLFLNHTARDLGLRYSIETTAWESLALANVMTAMAFNRRYAYHSLGALGAIEMTAPGRVSQVNEGLKRLGAPASARHYFSLHATLDVLHSEAWNREVLIPLIESDSRAARPIAEGALIRLHLGARCFERYRRELGISNKTNVTNETAACGIHFT